MEALGLLIKSCDRHVLKVYDAWLPYEENKANQLENEASMLDSKRSDICILFRGQKIRSHHSLWVVFLNCKEKNCTLHLIACILSAGTSFMEGAYLEGFWEKYS